METIPRFLKAPDESFFLFGPRGTGKSTWTRSLSGSMLRVDLLDDETFRLYRANIYAFLAKTF